MKQNPIIIIIICLGFIISSASVVTITFNTDNTSYSSGELIKLTGTISPVNDDQSVIVQIIKPSDSDLVAADQFLLNNDVHFQKYTLLMVKSGASKESIL